MELFKLLGTIAVDVGDSLKTIDDTASKAGSLGQKMQNVGGQIAGFGAKMTAVVGGAVVGAGTAMMSFASKTSATADNIDKMSQRLGLSRTAFQELDFALSQSGVDINSFQTGMKSLLANMDKVSEGNKTAVANFEALGISVVDSNGKMKDQETVLWETISAFQNMENSAEKSRLAQELFGKQGQEIIPLLNAESGSIEEMKNMAHDLGLVMGDDAVDAGVEFTDKMDQMKRAVQASVAELGAKLLPSITELVDLFIEKGVPAIERFVEKLSKVVDWFANLDGSSQKIIAVIGGVILAIGPLVTAIGTLITIGGTLATVIGAISAPVLIVVGVIGALVTAVIYLWNTSETFRNGVTGILADLKKGFDTFVADIKVLWNDHLKPCFDAISKFLKEHVLPAFETVFKGNILPLIQNIFKQIGTCWNSVLKPIFTGITDFLTGVFTGNWKKAFEGIKNIMKGSANFIIGCLETMCNAGIGMINGLLAGISGVATAVGSLIGLDPVSLNIPYISLPRLEKGGVLEEGQLGLLEGNGAEAVVPLDQNRKWIARVSQDMQDQGIGGNKETLDVMKQIQGMLTEYLPVMANMQMVLDSGALVGQIAPSMDSALGKLAIRNGRMA